MPRWWDSLCRYTHRLLRRVLRKDRHAEAQAAKPDLPDVPLEQSDVDHGALGTVAAPASASVEQQSNPQPAAQDIGSAVSVSGWSTVTDSPPATAGAVPADTTPAPGNPPQSSGATASAASPPFPNASFAPLTVPHCSPNTPPRPEFASFTVPYLCTSQPYDHLDFWTFPLRHGWNVHLADMVCHVLCPPGRRCQQQAEQEGEEERSPQPPIFSRVDGKPVRAEDKVAFLQAWLFFGVLDEVSRLCGLVIDVDAEFVAEAGDEVSTAGLNGLSSRWFEATKRTGRAGDKALMESVMKVARHARLMLTEEIVTEVPTTLLVQALAAGRVPKVFITDQLELEVIASDDHPYIALSHVWADGLGNPFVNALPKCQLRRLRGYVDELYQIYDASGRADGRTVGVWIDTLCIPVAPSAKQYRRTAIQLLGKTFHEANAVLVLDRELEIVESFPASFLEVGLRILCSGWMKRLWTLQEASLASDAHTAERIYFQMADGPFLYQKYDKNRKLMVGAHEDEGTPDIASEERHLLGDAGVMLSLGQRIPSVRAMRDSQGKVISHFYTFHFAIEHRSTSKIEDVPVCIASLMGLDLSAILSATTGEQRMAHFYQTVRSIPYGVLWRYEQKLSVPGFRWALASITSCDSNAYLGWDFGTCDADGLHVQLGGFVFSQPESLEEAPPSADDETLPPNATILSEQTGAQLLMQLFPPSAPPIPMQRNLALICKPRHRMDESPNAAVVAVEGTTDRGDEGTEFVCRIVGFAHLGRSRRTLDRVFRGNMTAPKQRWCIT